MPENREIRYSPEISHGEAAPDASHVEVLPEMAVPETAPVPAAEPPVLPVKKVTPSPTPSKPRRFSNPLVEISSADRMFENSPKTIENIAALEDMVNDAREWNRQNFFEKSHTT